MGDDDISVQISTETLIDFFNCPICMCQLTVTLMTPCGHRFCEGCIQESIGRHHRCPCCNRPTQNTELIKDSQYDALIHAFNQEKNKSEKIYFENLISTTSSEVSGQNNEENKDDTTFSPVELVLKKHLKAGMLAHSKYYSDMKREFSYKIQQIKNETDAAIIDLHEKAMCEQDIKEKAADLKEKCDTQVARVSDEMKICVNMVAEAYNRYLNEHIPDLSVLPVRVSVRLISKNVRLAGLVLQPHDTTAAINQAIHQHMNDIADPIENMPDNLKYIYFGPFSKRTDYEMDDLASSIVELGATNPNVFIVPDDAHIVLQCNIKPGGDILVYGDIKCKSDQPKQCFAAEYSKDSQEVMDYFACKNCSFNWICRPCMESCHKGHQIVPYIMNHRPTWACCYCPKKKTCLLTK